MAIQRSYPRLTELSLIQVQNAFNRAFDYIFQLQPGSSGGTGYAHGHGTGLVLTDTYEGLPGCGFLLDPGIWAITGVFDFKVDSTTGQADGRLAINGFATEDLLATYGPNTAGLSRATVTQTWTRTLQVQSSIQTQAKKEFAAGTGLAMGSCSVTAIKVGSV